MQEKNVLDYTEDELKTLDTEQLRRLASEARYNQGLYNTIQIVEKTLINSLYGALGNKWFPLFNEFIAQAITGNGRYFNRKLGANIEARLQKLKPMPDPYVIYGDTDSNYYHIAPFVDDFISRNPGLPIGKYVDFADNFIKKVIEPVVEETIRQFAEELNAYDPSKIGADREIIADAAVFTAKKKYYARVRDSEDTRFPDDEPKIKVMGLELIKSTTPLWTKARLKEVIPKILDSSEAELREWLRTIKSDFVKTELINIANVGGAERLDFSIGDKGIPIGSRAAIVHNNYIKSAGLDNRFSLIQPGDKSKRLFLIEPNKFGSDVIAFNDAEFVKEIDCVDYDTQFQKHFMSALNIMIAPLNYNLERQTEELDEW